MREFRFRTFVKDDKKMIYNNHSALAVKMFTPNYAYLNSEVEVMQYTGLIDKNGEEIYEGDIVRITEDDVFCGEEDFIGVVKFYECAFWIENTKEKNAYPLFNEISECEIIGNIYENPELLNA